MEFRSEAHRLAIKAAFIRVTSDSSWETMRNLADEVIYQLEQKALAEDDKEKRDAYIFDARGARKFWEKWLKMIELAKTGDADPGENFLEVVM